MQTSRSQCSEASMKKLFIIYIGGAHQNSLIELHDMRFVVANHIEETWQVLRENWWGTPASLHLDAWGILNYADGFDIQIADQPSLGNDKKLYFANLGGYDPSQFTELHKNIFVVAEDAVQAKQKAIQKIAEWNSAHRDYLYDVDTLLDVNHLVGDGHHLHLIPTQQKKDFEFVCRYTPIGKNKY